jgi:hypothetical protein
MNILETIIKDLQKDNGEKYRPNCATFIWYDKEVKRNRIRIDTNKIEKKL